MELLRSRADWIIKLHTKEEGEALVKACRDSLSDAANSFDDLAGNELPKSLAHIATLTVIELKDQADQDDEMSVEGLTAEEIQLVKNALLEFGSSAKLADRIKQSTQKNGVYDNPDIEYQVRLSEEALAMACTINEQQSR